MKIEQGEKGIIREQKEKVKGGREKREMKKEQ